MKSELYQMYEQVRPFYGDELSQCARHGDCVSCGLCCVTYEIQDLPITIPDDPSEPVYLHTSEAWDPCRHLKLNEGRMACSLHDEKNHSSLRVCRDWRGNQMVEPEESWKTNFDEIMEVFWARVRVGMDLPLANLLVEKGLIQYPFSHYYQWTKYSMRNFLTAVLALDDLPVELLDDLNMLTVLVNMQRAGYEFFDLIDLEKDTHRRFVQHYFSRKMRLALNSK